MSSSRNETCGGVVLAHKEVRVAVLGYDRGLETRLTRAGRVMACVRPTTAKPLSRIGKLRGSVLPLNGAFGSGCAYVSIYPACDRGDTVGSLRASR